MKGKQVACAITFVALMPPAYGAHVANPSRWPVVAPVDASVHFADGATANLEVALLSPSGKNLYRLECHTFAYEDKSFNYSGDFECRLTPAAEERHGYATLFVDKESTKEWDTRARFNLAEVTGKCGDYLEYGRIRSFRLRGMKLMLILSDVVPETSTSGVGGVPRPRFRSFGFRLRVDSDASAQSEIAELPRVHNPLRPDHETPGHLALQCETVVPRTPGER